MSDCREWARARNKKGYGVVWINEDQQMRLVHRVAYQEAIGPIPDGMCVLHKCDNRACYNPDHLFLGTAQDNTNDMVEKGRDKFSNRKYDHAEILALVDSGLTQREVAAKVGCDASNVSHILRNLNSKEEHING